MKRYLSALFTGLFFLYAPALRAQEPIHEIEIGMMSTTHVLFLTDLTYVDVSIPDVILAELVQASKNVLALKASAEFDFVTTISALESNGTMHTFRVRYNPFPDNLIVDTRAGRSVGAGTAVNTQKLPEGVSGKTDGSRLVTSGQGAMGQSTFARMDAPTLEEVMREPQHIYHVCDRSFGVEACCINVYVYSDLTYVVLRIRNSTDIGFTAGNAQFSIESRTRNTRAIAVDKEVWAVSSFGTLSCGPGDVAVAGYTIPKLTLLKNQCLRIYVHETNGNRNLILSLSEKDINYAVSPRQGN